MVGNYKFKLSDMIPSAWLFKFEYMTKGRRSLANSNTNHSRKGIRKASSASTQPQPSKTKQPHQSNPRESYYFTRKLIPGDEKPKVSESDCYTTYGTPSPTKSSQQRLRRTSTVTPPSTTKLAGSSVSPGCDCRVKLESVRSQSESPFEYSSYPLDTCPEIRTDGLLPTESSDEMFSWSSSCGYRVSSGARDSVMDVDRNSLDVQCDKLDDYDALSELELPPIVTKPAKFSDMVIDIKKETKTKANSSRSVNYEETRKQRCLRVKIAKEEMTSIKEQRHIAGRRLSVSSPGVRLRTKSPKISNSKVQALMSRKRVSSSTRRNRSLSDSYAVVKSSSDPERDFRDSMVEMIVENNIRASKDLEDLLACYLSLNSDEYHGLIVKVFKQLWFDLVDTR